MPRHPEAGEKDDRTLSMELLKGDKMHLRGTREGKERSRGQNRDKQGREKR